MDLSQAKALAIDLMTEHGLFNVEEGEQWQFKFDHAVSRFGNCNHTTRTISLSRKLVGMNPEEEVRDTILHEIAHALVGRGEGHGPVWRAKALEIGCNGSRTHDAASPEGRYHTTCIHCGNTGTRHRMEKGRSYACAYCCQEHNGGRYTPRFNLVWLDTKTQQLVG